MRESNPDSETFLLASTGYTGLDMPFIFHGGIAQLVRALA